jgi:hypothetical protein
MRWSASLHKFLNSLLALFMRRAPAFAALPCALLAAEEAPAPLRKSSPRLIRLIEAAISPARYFFGPYAIGPP